MEGGGWRVECERGGTDQEDPDQPDKHGAGGAADDHLRVGG